METKFWGYGFPFSSTLVFGEISDLARRKIRYEEKSSILVHSFVLHHHPNNVYHLTTKTDEGLGF